MTCLPQQVLRALLFPQQTPTEWHIAFIVFKYSHAPCREWILGAKVPPQAWAGFGQPVLSKASTQSHWAHSPVVKKIYKYIYIYKNQLSLQLTSQQATPSHLWVDGSQVTTVSSDFPQGPWPFLGKANLTQGIFTSAVPTSVRNPIHTSLTTYLFESCNLNCDFYQAPSFCQELVSPSRPPHISMDQKLLLKCFQSSPFSLFASWMHHQGSRKREQFFQIQDSCIAPSWNWPKQGTDRAQLMNESPGPFSRVTMGKGILTPA